MKDKKLLMAILSVVVASATTATLDWAWAKVVETEINVPIFTPAGTFEQPITVEERRGRFTGRRYAR
jgi:hypothetical protein